MIVLKLPIDNKPWNKFIIGLEMLLDFIENCNVVGQAVLKIKICLVENKNTSGIYPNESVFWHKSI